jgi:hypothetical protein
MTVEDFRIVCAIVGVAFLVIIVIRRLKRAPSARKRPW